MTDLNIAFDADDRVRERFGARRFGTVKRILRAKVRAPYGVRWDGNAGTDFVSASAIEDAVEDEAEDYGRPPLGVPS